MARTLLAIYPRPGHRYDEMLDDDGRVREHWRKLFIHLDSVTPEAMRQRLDFVDRCIQENGVTYNIYADSQGQDRPWALDPLPLIIPAEEWRSLAQAVAQRARLLNAILADLYGPQTLLAEGLLPPALVYGQHGFLWPCMGIRPPGDVFLHHYAVDLARSPDGRWWVIADRTQAPSGAGYALENRLIVSRVFPELFRDMKVQHLASFFRELQESLENWAPTDPGERPFIVLLTPGPYNETYFEHAYLARYLGYPLVEGQDLTVRGDTVYLKTLTGLKRVHAILRRQDDDYCDPLELRGDSALGIPGLLMAARAGRVLVSNALGSGLLGSGALMGFLPPIARRLLGEELSMPSVATWWCGEKPAQSYAIQHLDELVIKPAYPTQRFEPVFGRDLAGEARQEMIRRIEARPHAYVAQELVNLSQAPTWSRDHERRLLARSVGLRLYAVATPEGYQVMPGGLSRVSGSAQALVISMQRGGASKDTWVLADGPVNTFSLLKPVLGSRDLVRSGNNLSSRVVENLFWFGRYTERFDDTARLLRVALSRLVEAGGQATPELEAVVELCVLAGIAAPGNPPGVPEAAAWIPVETRLLDAIFAAEAENSLAAAIRRLLWSATQVRERLSVDHWHSLNRLQRSLVAGQERRSELGGALAFLDQVLLVSSSLTGFSMDNMTRDNGWRFLVVGRRIERLSFLSRTLGAALHPFCSQEGRGLEWLLELTDSIITYRSRYSRQPELLPVLDLVIFDESNPHSVMFQVQVIQRYLERLERELGGASATALDQEARALAGFDLALFQLEPQQACLRLTDHLARLAAAAHELSDLLGMRFFTHVDAVTHQTLAI
ncbi:circularly permuted type 2 ATP-grasp protein [Azovibrio restrictus]|uniref:circularly permuted type 2 ATP-grasp protein n=1 Tax=Azovibrio restrictus TaxID=146938 RepID=UPI0026EE70BF|nr:circularly permuted type 2 ATP-grasp protein [Azovibrio restrictus]